MRRVTIWCIDSLVFV